MSLVAILGTLQEEELGVKALDAVELLDPASTSSWRAFRGKKFRPC